MTDFLTLLDRDQLIDIGIDGFAYGYADRVRFHELDALNHVNNVVYLRWFETIRVRYVQDYGFTRYRDPDDPQLVVRRVSADYFAPMFQDQSYVLTARTTLVKPSSFLMEYGLFVEGERVATGDAVVVSLSADGSARQAHAARAVERVISRDGAATEGF